MYPQVMQSETRWFELRRELQLVDERKPAAERNDSRANSVPRHPQPLAVAMRRQAVGRG